MLPGLVLALLLSGCSGPDEKESLAPLAHLARSAADECASRVTRARVFLEEEIALHPGIGQVLAGEGVDRARAIPWENTPYIAVGVHGQKGDMLAVLPSGGEGVKSMLAQAATGPETGELTLIANAFSFTLPMRHALPGQGTISALVDVDRVLTADVLRPASQAAHGLAFLANKDGRIALATHRSMTGKDVSTWDIPVPSENPAGEATGRITMGETEYFVATAVVNNGHGWLVGILTPVAQPEK